MLKEGIDNFSKIKSKKVLTNLKIGYIICTQINIITRERKKFFRRATA